MSKRVPLTINFDHSKPPIGEAIVSDLALEQLNNMDGMVFAPSLRITKQDEDGTILEVEIESFSAIPAALAAKRSYDE